MSESAVAGLTRLICVATFMSVVGAVVLRLTISKLIKGIAPSDATDGAAFDSNTEIDASNPYRTPRVIEAGVPGRHRISFRRALLISTVATLLTLAALFLLWRFLLVTRQPDPNTLTLFGVSVLSVSAAIFVVVFKYMIPVTWRKAIPVAAIYGLSYFAIFFACGLVMMSLLSRA